MITPCFQNLDGESGNVRSHNSEIDTVYLQLPSQTPWLTQGKCRRHFSQLQSLPLLISHHVSASFPAARMGPALKAKSSSLSQPPVKIARSPGHHHSINDHQTVNMGDKMKTGRLSQKPSAELTLFQTPTPGPYRKSSAARVNSGWTDSSGPRWSALPSIAPTNVVLSTWQGPKKRTVGPKREHIALTKSH